MKRARPAARHDQLCLPQPDGHAQRRPGDLVRGGLQAVDLSDPTNPAYAGEFRPRPLPAVATEDPAVTQGRYKVGMWSYPVVQDGLIYVTDIRNGLYVLRYTGPHADEVTGLSFYEGNSNLGDAGQWD